MKTIVLLAAMILLISTCSAIFTPTGDDMKWLHLIESDSKIIASDMTLAASATSNVPLDAIKAKTYFECLKSNASRALDESEKFMVSNELQKTKNYYELSLNEFYSAATETLDGINMDDASKFENATIHLMEGKRYITLSTNELNLITNPGSLTASATFDSITTVPYKISFDLGLPRDAYNVTVADPKSTETLGGDKITIYEISIKNSTPFTFDMMYINLAYQDTAQYSQNLSSIRQYEVVYKQALESEYTRVETATREIDGTWGIVARADDAICHVIYYPLIDSHLKMVISSTYPWDEGTLSLLKTIHVEKVNTAPPIVYQEPIVYQGIKNP
jgi:hypothetical protein